MTWEEGAGSREKAGSVPDGKGRKQDGNNAEHEIRVVQRHRTARRRQGSVRRGCEAWLRRPMSLAVNKCGCGRCCTAKPRRNRGRVYVYRG
jgi:hypothetical protein